jgi:FG-GAP-like repeat/FG-GAP repeat
MLRSCPAAALLFAFSANALAQTVTFTRDDVPSFAGARAIATADFNRDGRPDIAIANSARNSVTILLDRAGAGLTRAGDFPVAAGPFDLATGDFNRDGIPDLAVANADGNSISVLLGRGDGTFSRNDIAASGQNPRGIAVADVNNDGKPDLIYSGYATGVVQVLIGNGAGGFTKGVTYVSSALHPQGLATADFDHDGHLDVAVAYESATGLRILYGNGGTAFTARTITGDANLNVLGLADFNGDGWMDVAAASTANSIVAIYLASASGLAHTQTSVVGSSPRGVAIGDLNHDGIPDLVTANRASSTVSVLPGDPAHRGTFLSHAEVAAGLGSRALVLADFDADGRLDIATANQSAASATVLSNRTFFESSAFAFRRATIGDETTVSQITKIPQPADFNRDGRADLAVGGETFESITILLTGKPAVSLPVDGVLDDFSVADVNGDGNPDVVYATQGPDVVGTYLGDGRGGFVKAPTTPSARVIRLATGDMNRDGRADLVSVGFDDAVNSWVLQVSLAGSAGRFALPATTVLLPGFTPSLAVGDLNRDGKLDVVALLSGLGTGHPSELNVWFGNGTGGLTPTSLTTRFVHDIGVAFDLADVNQDGFVDVVAADGDTLAVALGGAAGFSAPVNTAVAADGSFLGTLSVGDLNDDGHPDVAFQSGDVMFGNGDGAFVFGGRFDYAGAVGFRVAEFTGDGLPDIVASSQNGVVVLANTRSHTNHAPTVNAGPDQTLPFSATQGEDCAAIAATASDPDAHALTFEWRRDGVIVSDRPGVDLCALPPGSYVFAATVRDGRGGVATDTVTVTIEPIKEIVLWAADASAEGQWTLVDDATAAGGVRAHDLNAGAPKVTTPAASPTGNVTIRFFADPTQTYKLWIRLKADGNSWANDSVWVQFSGAADLAGVQKYRVGTTSGLSVSLEECLGCGVSGWGWEDDGWGAPNTNGVLLRFPQSLNPDRDPQSMVIQTREDGVSIDQIVLSAETYLTARPGAAKNDTTILRSTQPPR